LYLTFRGPPRHCLTSQPTNLGVSHPSIDVYVSAIS